MKAKDYSENIIETVTNGTYSEARREIKEAAEKGCLPLVMEELFEHSENSGYTPEQVTAAKTFAALEMAALLNNRIL